MSQAYACLASFCSKLVYWVDFGVPMGSAPGFRRPALVLQSDEYNATALNTVIVVPFTSNLNLADYKPNVYVTAE